MKDGKNYRRDTRQSYKPGSERDNCGTPGYALLPLFPYLPKDWTIWEPAAGEGLMVSAFRQAGYNCWGSTIEDGYDFLQYGPNIDTYDVIITNPPFSQSEKFIRRCFELGSTWALLLKTEVLQNQGIQKLISRNGDIEHIHPESRINFKMPNAGWKAKGATFNTHWFTYGLNIGREHTYLCPINKAKKEFHNGLA